MSGKGRCLCQQGVWCAGTGGGGVASERIWVVVVGTCVGGGPAAPPSDPKGPATPWELEEYYQKRWGK